MEWLDSLLENELIASALVIIVGVTIYFIIVTIFKRITKLSNKRIAKKGKLTEREIYVNRRKATYFRLIKNVIKYIILILVILSILSIYGVDVNSILVGLGIASVIAGLALQDALKDIIAGFNIITDDFYSVGDIIEYNDSLAKVTELGLKSTKLRDIFDGSEIVVSNRNISEARTASKQLDIKCFLPYNLSVAATNKFINTIIAEISQLPKVGHATCVGLQNFGDSSLEFKLRLQCDPIAQPQIKREVNRIIWEQAEKSNINIPFNQLDVHLIK